ncbi:hypothetical protein FRB97_009728, partial [Tulasnella sp. 331]
MSTLSASSSGSGLGAGKYNTVRERRAPLSSHSRWASEDLNAPRDEHDEVHLNNSRGPVAGQGRRPWRYENRGGSAESALADGRTLVGEGLRAAGLTRRRGDGRRDEDVFTSSKPGTGKGKERERPEFLIPTSTGITHSSSASSAVSESRSATEMRNDRLPRLTNGAPKASPSSIPGGTDESDWILASGTSSSSRNLPVRPVTSMDASPDCPSRTAPPPLRSYRSSFIVAQRDNPTIPPPLPLPTPTMDRRALTADGRERNSPSRAAFSTISPLPPSRRNTPGPNHRHTYSASPTPPHATVLQDALRLFENNVERNTSLHPVAASGCLTSADTLVQPVSSLNALLPANLDKATFAHVDAMVGEDRGVGDDCDLWHSMSANLQKGVK